ncbi:MAG TPA: nucleotidyltransferase family protein [Gemmatimonadaceae bacterium]|nr:nucleotidyltransferase family protein [Gemmatimonadaceae bacterium]
MITGLLLAAGGARRFGSQKLVAPYRGATVVEHAARILRGETDDLIVVVGSEADAVRRALREMNAHIVENERWALGLSTSLRRGVEAVAGDVEAIIVSVGDQPLLEPAVIRGVAERWRATAKPIVSASYRGVRGHPVLFARSMFGALAELEGDAGARLLIERSGDRVAYVEIDAPMPSDVDTPDDLARLSSQAQRF